MSDVAWAPCHRCGGSAEAYGLCVPCGMYPIEEALRRGLAPFVRSPLTPEPCALMWAKTGEVVADFIALEVSPCEG